MVSGFRRGRAAASSRLRGPNESSGSFEFDFTECPAPEGAELFQISERASVDLGLEDGTLMTLNEDEPQKNIAMYFRNNGHLTATNVVVEARTAIVPPSADVSLPAVGWKPDLVKGFTVLSGETMSPKGLVGPDIGAGTPYIYKGLISDQDIASAKTLVPIQNLKPDVLMMEPAEDWYRCDASDLLRWPKIWSVFIQ